MPRVSFGPQNLSVPIGWSRYVDGSNHFMGGRRQTEKLMNLKSPWPHCPHPSPASWPPDKFGDFILIYNWYWSTICQSIEVGGSENNLHVSLIHSCHLNNTVVAFFTGEGNKGWGSTQPGALGRGLKAWSWIACQVGRLGTWVRSDS